MKFMVLNRESFEALHDPWPVLPYMKGIGGPGLLEKPEPFIVISITDPYSEPAKSPRTKYIGGRLELQFHDWDDHAKVKIQSMEKSEHAKRMVYFSKRDADKVVDFVRKHQDSVDLIVVHCEAGISRSAGLAASLCKCINGYDGDFFSKYLPNRRVYRLVMNAWYGEE